MTTDGPAPDELLGRIIAGRFRIERHLRRGGMGAVYVAADLEAGSHGSHQVAVKVVRESLLEDGEAIARFKREARLIVNITHENIVGAIAVGDDAGLLYIAMELLDGESLRDRLEEQGRMTWQETLPLIEQIVRALGAAHDAKVVHRDLKPENVMLVGPDRNVAKLLDFGIAKRSQEDNATSSNMTGTGLVVGTPGYVAPEVVLGGMTDDLRADFYALGVTWFEMLTGQVPFTAKTPFALALRHAQEPAPTPTSVVPFSPVPAPVEQLVMRLLAKTPSERPATSSELLALLASIKDAAVRQPEPPTRSSIPTQTGYPQMSPSPSASRSPPPRAPPPSSAPLVSAPLASGRPETLAPPASAPLGLAPPASSASPRAPSEPALPALAPVLAPPLVDDLARDPTLLVERPRRTGTPLPLGTLLVAAAGIAAVVGVVTLRGPSGAAETAGATNGPTEQVAVGSPSPTDPPTLTTSPPAPTATPSGPLVPSPASPPAQGDEMPSTTVIATTKRTANVTTMSKLSLTPTSSSTPTPTVDAATTSKVTLFVKAEPAEAGWRVGVDGENPSEGTRPREVSPGAHKVRFISRSLHVDVTEVVNIGGDSSRVVYKGPKPETFKTP